MKKLTIACLFLSLLVTSPVFASGRLVAIGDDWPFGTSYDSSNNGNVFAKSALNWLTGETANKTVLFDQFLYQNQWWTLSPLKTYLQNAGYSITVASVSTWNSQNLAGYGAVIWASSSATGLGTMLSNYSANGGNILYVGGIYMQPASDAATLLNPLGIQDSGVLSDNRVTLTTFSAHPCVANVQSLRIGGSTTLSLLSNFDGQVVSAQGGKNFILAVPEPASLLLMAFSGLILMRKANR